jgi:ubiquitin
MNKRPPNKICSSCKEAKYLKDFSKNKNRPDGHHTQCKLCRSKYKPSEESRKKNNDVRAKMKELIEQTKDLVRNCIRNKEGLGMFSKNMKTQFQ